MTITSKEQPMSKGTLIRTTYKMPIETAKVVAKKQRSRGCFVEWIYNHSGTEARLKIYKK